MLLPPGPEEPGQPEAARICGSCGARLEPAYQYCPTCGAPFGPVSPICPDCGATLGGDYRFCVRCGRDVSAITGAGWQPAFSRYPVRFDVPYPERLSRLSTLFRLVLAVPQLFIAYALSTVAGVVSLIAGVAILFTGRYPPGLFNLVVGFNRWVANVFAYLALLRDEYPPFSTEPGRYPVVYEVDYPARLSRLLIFVKWWLLILVHQVLYSLLAIIGVLFLVLSWFAILFTGHYPRTFFDFNVGLMRWYLRVGAYAGLLRDEFPPYSKRADAPAGGRTSVIVAAVLGVVGWSAQIALFVFSSSVDPSTETVVVSYEDVLDGRATAMVSIDGTEVRLLGGEDPAEGRRPAREDRRFVSFDLAITNRDAWLTSVALETFRLRDASGRQYSPVSGYQSGISGVVVDKGETVRITVMFEVRERQRVSSLTYSPGIAAYTPFGERVRYEFR